MVFYVDRGIVATGAGKGSGGLGEGAWLALWSFLKFLTCAVEEDIKELAVVD